MNCNNTRTTTGGQLQAKEEREGTAGDSDDVGTVDAGRGRKCAT